MDPSHHILFLWRNNNSVIIGQHQNPWVECNIEKMRQDNINLVRRHSGGGAVFQDLGNTCFTFLSSRKVYDRERNYNIIINSLKKFGIKAERRGRNDLIVDDKKVSGSAFKETPDRAFHHGTLLINVDLSKLANYLTPKQKKLIAKGIKSTRSRVANLKEFHPDISHETLTEAIIEEFFKTYNAERHIETLDYNALKNIPELQEYYKKLKHTDWIFGETPEFNHHLEERFSWGVIDVHLHVEKGMITQVKIYSDALNTEMIDLLTKHLHKIEYNKEALQKSLQKTHDKLPEVQEHIEEFTAWICKEIT